ncbi:MAG: TatD family hydrolase [Acidobacteriota bacterium]
MRDKKMTHIIDSHAHLNVEDFDKDRDEVVKRAFDAGIKSILCPTEISDEKNVKNTYNLIKKYPQILAAAGIHPHNAKLFHQNLENRIIDMAEKRQIIAVGEIGLDFHYNYSPPSKQKIVFQKQLSLAQKLGLPVIIHSRSAASDVLELLKKQNFTNGGILHCFTENLEFAKIVISKGFYISFSGIITYPKAHSLREIATEIPLSKILVETDAPFLTPVPYQKKVKRNEPSFVIETAKILAGLKKISYESFAEKMCENFSSFLNLTHS